MADADLRERELRIRRRAIEPTVDMNAGRFSTYEVNVLLRRIDFLEAALAAKEVADE